MDRFIDSYSFDILTQTDNLKSNMDRFIVKQLFPGCKFKVHLKSNMDRFIENFSIKRAVPS